MVQVQRPKTTGGLSICKKAFKILAIVGFIIIYIAFYFDPSGTSTQEKSLSNKKSNDKQQKDISCEYKSLSDLKPYELYPKKSELLDANGRRHMVDPPKDGKITLVCCDTTVGSLSVAIHHNWAPIGAQRFLEMVQNEYFSSKVALMRCVRNFICQFGLAGDPKLNKSYKSIPDDPNWLPEGPSFRTNEYGTYRFAQGYMAYAGSGKNSRDKQLIVALGNNQRLGGGSPWEVPFGEIVGINSYETLGNIYTGYGENGPKQGLLMRKGSSSEVAEQFPELDYVTSCVVVDTAEINK